MITDFEDIGISGMAAVVPVQGFEVASLGEKFGDLAIKRAMQATGVQRMRITPPEMTASDLCWSAANRLMTQMECRPLDIEALVFVSTTPDYIAPPTSHILHARLGLSGNVPCFDLPFGCSGYIYGLLQSAMIIRSGIAARVLLLTGETSTKSLAPEDRSTRVLFGDAGSATIVEARPGKRLYLSTYTDGTGYRHIMVPSSALRISSEPKFLVMNGGEVFSFAGQRVPEAINALLEYSQTNIDAIDCFAFHQASKTILNLIARKLKIPSEKILSSLAEFGNTGSASIPLSFIADPATATLARKNVLMCGFGTGLSWGVVQSDLSDTFFCQLASVSSPDGGSA